MSASLGSASLLVAVFVCVCAGQTELTTNPGANTTLECRGSSGAAVSLLRWSKPDLQSQLYVFFFRDNSPVESFQLPSFRGRVQLKDPQVNNGDFSVILKNVSMNDGGTYECQVRYGNQEIRLLNTIVLKVVEPGQPGGDVGLAVGLSVTAVVLVASAVGFFFYRKQKQIYN